jgi:DNA replication protein DnaC
MTLQGERIGELCQALSLNGIEQEYAALAQRAATAEHSYSDYLEQCLKAEQQARQQRSRSVLVKMAGFPAIKLLEDYDFAFAAGAPKRQIQQLASLAFVERKANVILLGPQRRG